MTYFPTVHSSYANPVFSKHSAQAKPVPLFGWKKSDNLPADFGYVYVDSNDLTWGIEKSKRIKDRDGKRRRIETPVPEPSPKIVVDVAQKLNRGGENYLSRPGFAYVVTPFLQGEQLTPEVQAAEFAKAKLFAQSLMRQVYALDKRYYNPKSVKVGKGGTAQRTDFASDRRSTYRRSASVTQTAKYPEGTMGYQSFKLPHYDRTNSCIAFIQGPNYGISGGTHRVADIHDYLKTNQLAPVEVFDDDPLFYSAVYKTEHLEALAKNYTLELKPVEGRIGIFIVNNFAQQGGVFHGATPVEIVNPEAHKRQFRQLFFPKVGNPEKTCKVFCHSKEPLN